MPKVLIIYRTKKNIIKFRLVDFPTNREIGETTSMGWYVLDIQYYYNGRFYKENEFYQLLEKQEEKSIDKEKLNWYRRLFKKI